jgi:outer membrane lipoprotein-sorting protein
VLFGRLIATARSASTSGLVVGLAVCLLAGASIAAIAIAATSSGPVPRRQPLASAVHDALTAPAVEGVSARIAFTDKLVDSAAVQGSDPLLSGATGRLWVGAGHRFRLELQSDRGDVQVVSDGTTLGVYDPGLDLAYRVVLPRPAAGAEPSRPDAGPPTLAQVQDDLGRLMRHAVVSGARPTDVAGRPAYDVRVSPRRDGGLLGGAELAWDAVRGVPLRVAVYARGDQTPVLALQATDVSYGPVPASVFEVPAPQGVKVTDVRLHPARAGAGRAPHGAPAPITGLAAVRAALPFAPTAPARLAGMARSGVRLLDLGRERGALVTYGRGLGGLAVVELPGAQAPARLGAAGHGHGEGPGLSLPTTRVGGATAQVLPTALGTLVRFSRGGVTYLVAGSVTSAVAEAAARGL